MTGQRTADPKAYARGKLRWFIRSGQMVRQSCEKCGAKKTDAHHDDYSAPVTVRWLCRSCHRIEHAQSQTHCKRGHPFTGDNLIIYRRQRVCRECRNMRARKPWLLWRKES